MRCWLCKDTLSFYQSLACNCSNNGWHHNARIKSSAFNRSPLAYALELKRNITMSTELPPCPKCNSPYAYEDQAMLICPECGYEWDPNAPLVDEDALIVKDANGNQLAEGDFVTLIKDLKVKGTSSTAKIGTRAKVKRLVDGDHNIDCKMDGFGDIMLKSEFVKRA